MTDAIQLTYKHLAGVSWLNLGMLQMNVCAYVYASCSNLGMLQMNAAASAVMLQETFACSCECSIA